MKKLNFFATLPLLFALFTVTTITTTTFAANKAKITPTPTPISACLAEIVYAVNAKGKKCQSFSSTCYVPKNWTVVNECPVPTPTKTPNKG